MRGADSYIETMFTMARLDDFVPANHPLRPIRIWLNDALKRMDPVFARMTQASGTAERDAAAEMLAKRAFAGFGAASHEDLLQEACAKLLGGERVWHRG